MVSIIARPTNKVRDSVLAISGWRRGHGVTLTQPRPDGADANRQGSPQYTRDFDPIHLLASCGCSASPTAPPMNTIASTLKM